MLNMIFREYDIKGLYDEELNEKSVKTIGSYLGEAMLQRGCKDVSIGRSVRYNGDGLFAYLVGSLNKAGIKIYDIGLVSTPLGYSSLYGGLQFNASIMITGSRNPKDYNGFRITIGEESFFGAELEEFSKEVYRYLDDETPQDLRAEKYDILSLYVEFMEEQFGHLTNFNYEFALDCASDAVGVALEPLIKTLDLKAHFLFKEPGGTFPNHPPNPTENENLIPPKEFLKQNQNIQMAFAFGGDTNRVVALNKTHTFYGDEPYYLFAKDIENPRILGEVKCSKNLFNAVKQSGVISMGRTGHSNIKRMVKELDIDLAAEVSGHIFFEHRYFSYDDGIYALLRALELIFKGYDLESLINALPKLYTTLEPKIPISGKEKFKPVEALEETVRKGTLKGVKELCEIDGARMDFKDGWALPHASNTNPYLITRFGVNMPLRARELETMVSDPFRQIKDEGNM